MWKTRSFTALHDGAPAPVVPVPVAAQVRCVYCRAPISSEVFEFLSPNRRLVSADCAHCGRTVTMLATIWRRETARTLHVSD